MVLRCKFLEPNGTLVWYSYATEILVALVPVWKNAMRAEYFSEIVFSDNRFFNPPNRGYLLRPRGCFWKSDSPVLWDTYPFKWSQRRFVWIAYGPEIQLFYWKESFYDRWRNETNHPTPDRKVFPHPCTHFNSACFYLKTKVTISLANQRVRSSNDHHVKDKSHTYLLLSKSFGQNDC